MVSDSIKMENQENIIPMGRLHGLIVDIEGVNALDEFEVIEIFDDNNPYPAFLRPCRRTTLYHTGL